MKKYRWLAGLAVVAALVFTGIAATSSGPNFKLFGTGDVFVNGHKFATFNDAGEYGGVYRDRTNTPKLRNDVIDLEFVNDRAVGGGAPRFSIPIDENNDRKVEAYAFMDVNGCGSSTVSTKSSTCQVFYKSDVYPNWDAFGDAHPDWRLARKDSGEATMPFIIADVEGDYLVHGIVLNY